MEIILYSNLSLVRKQPEQRIFTPEIGSRHLSCRNSRSPLEMWGLISSDLQILFTTAISLITGATRRIYGSGISFFCNLAILFYFPTLPIAYLILLKPFSCSCYSFPIPCLLSVLSEVNILHDDIFLLFLSPIRH